MVAKIEFYSELKAQLMLRSIFYSTSHLFSLYMPVQKFLSCPFMTVDYRNGNILSCISPVYTACSNDSFPYFVQLLV